MTKKTNNVPKVTHSRPLSPSSSEPCSLGDFTSRQVWARMVSLSATPSTHPNNGRILTASPDCCRRYTIYSTEAFLKPTVYQVLFWKQKWRREWERLSLYTHRSDGHKWEVVKPAKAQALENNENYQGLKPHLVEQLKPRTPTTAKAGEAVGQREPWFIAGGNAKCWQPHWRTVWQLLTKLTHSDHMIRKWHCLVFTHRS